MNFSIVDSHLHLWDNDYLTYPWLEYFPDLNHSFLLTNLLEATKSLHVESFVFIQSTCCPEQSLDEVKWVTKLAKRDPRIRGIVAYAPLEIGLDIQPYLAELSQNSLVKGVRRILHTESEDFCLREEFIEGAKLLTDFNFSFDVCVKPQQLPAAIQLIERCPAVNFILDHMGSPIIAAKQLQPWQDQLSQLAALPNVWCKISGLMMAINQQTWCSEEFKPYILHAIEKFGMDRVMFGSDWPAVNVAGSYSHWVHTLQDLLLHSPYQDSRKLFYENAQKCYNLVSATVEI